MEGKERIASVVVAAFVIFSLCLSLVSSLILPTVDIPTSGWIGDPLVAGLPSADVYVVRNDVAGNYVTINGLDRTQVLETNTSPVTAINNAITRWVPINGKIVTNGTMPDWSGTVTPTHGNFTWEAWKTAATQTSSSGSWVAGINLEQDHITIRNLTFIGRGPNHLDIGIRSDRADYLTITNCTITNCVGLNAISLGTGIGHSVTYCNVSFNYKAYQICFNSIADSIISHNTVNAGKNGSCIGFFGDNVHTYKNVTVSFNKVSYWGPSILWHGIYGTGTLSALVYNNTFISSGGGCDLQLKCRGASAYNNTFDGSAGGTWAFGISHDPVPVDAYSPNGTRFYSNVIQNYRMGAMYLASGSGYSTGNVTITGNTIMNCSTGIQMVAESSTVYNQNWTISLNTITGPGTAGTYGIRCGYADPQDYSDSIKILNNTISGFSIGVWVYPHALNPVINFNNFSDILTRVIFQPSTTATFRFNTGLAGYNMLNISGVGGGVTSPSGLGWQYESSSIASVTWTPNTGYVRQDISIDGIYQHTTVSPINVTMSTNHVVIAYFVSAP